METDLSAQNQGVGRSCRDGAIKETTLQLLDYCQANNWSGYDPYDALNSPFLHAVPFLNCRVVRILLTQILKRSPVNLRPLLRVPKTENPKAIALFLSALLKLRRLGVREAGPIVESMANRLRELRSPNTNHWCWGYSFPWQTRKELVPKGAPNLVTTTFVANALLDAYEAGLNAEYLEAAAGAAGYIANELYWREGTSAAGFSYPLPTVRARVHNANFLAAALLCRVFRHTGEKRLLKPALRAARYSARQQRDDGSWDYGELPTQRWIDNFHTGYNLVSLRAIGRALETTEFESRATRGFNFYRKHFFRSDSAPRYFHNRTYPIDAHCVAQSILTLIEFRDRDAGNLMLARRVCDWALRHMRDEQGCFYYRVLPLCTIRTSHMRWSQAWMLLALATLWEQGQ
jgi:hypothetical protein